MHLASFFSSFDVEHADRRRRLVSLSITLVVHLLLLWMLLRLAPPVFTKMADRGKQLLSFNTAPDEQVETTQSKSTAKTKKTRTAAPLAPTVPPPKIVLQDKAAPWVLTPGLEKFDVRHVPTTQPTQSQSQSDASASDDANGNSDSDRPAAYGSGGQPLYAAQWYREPTDAELHYYLKDARPGAGYGEIACQTVARYHVDHCEEIGETLGSGLARAVREAAWQFLVLPPRIGGHMQVGAWVLIRINYTEAKAR